MHKRQTNKLTLDTKGGKKITKKFQIIKKGSFFPLVFPLMRFILQSASLFLSAVVFVRLEKMCCPSLHSCLLSAFLTPPADVSFFFFTFKQP